MTIDAFMAAHPTHPLGDALGFMESSKSAPEMERWQSFCHGMLAMMRHHGELTAQAAESLKAEIDGTGRTVQ